MLVLGCQRDDVFHLTGGIRIRVEFVHGSLRLVFDIPDRIQVVLDKAKHRGEPLYAANLRERLAKAGLALPEGEK